MSKDTGFLVVNPGRNESFGTMEVDLSPPEMKKLHVVSNERNRYTRTMVTSIYSNTASCSQEATFSIVLPDSAFISGFVMEIKGKKYEAYVKEKEEAKQEYQAAVLQGRGAAHVAVNTRDSNKFNVSVNVESQSDVTFILTYEELLIRKHNLYEVIINLQTDQFIDDLGVNVNINETRPVVNVEIPALRSGNEINTKNTKNNYVTIKKESNEIVHVTFHPTIKQQKEIIQSMTSNDENKGFLGQFVVQYDVERDPSGGEVLVNDGYFVHFFAPTDLKPIPKQVIFVLDVSGSMHGRKIEQLQQAMTIILSELNSDDYFNVIIFNNTVQILFSKNQDSANLSLPVTCENIEKTKKAIRSIIANGGTNIYDALVTALSLTSQNISSSKGNQHKPQPIIIFLTDGQANVGILHPNKIIEAVESRNNNKCAIFTLAFGNDANKEFLKELAMKNSGFLRNIYEAADASLQLQDFYKQISSPLLTNVTFKYSDKIKELTKHNYDIFFNGTEFIVAGKIDKMENDFVFVEASTLLGRNKFCPTIIPITSKPEQKEKYGNLERLWAYMTIKQLLDIKYENKNSDKNVTKSQQQALKLALKYSFVTPITSLVVVKPEETSESDLQWYPVQMNTSRNVKLRGGWTPSTDLRMKSQSTSSSAFGSSSSLFCLRFGNAGCSRKSFGQNSLQQCVQAGPSPNSPQQFTFGSAVSSQNSPQQFTFSNAVSSQNNRQQFTFGTASSSQNSPQQFSFGTASSSQNSPQQCASSSSLQSLFPLSLKNKQIPSFLSDIWTTALEMKSMNVKTNVSNREGHTVISKKFSNASARALQKVLPIILPKNAIFRSCEMDIEGNKYISCVKEKEEANKIYIQAIAQGVSAAHITYEKNTQRFILSINLEPKCSATFILTYEEILIRENGKYTLTLNLNPGQLVENLEISIKINNANPILNVKTSVLQIENISRDLVTIINKSNQCVNINFCPTIEQQKEIMNILKQTDFKKGVCGQFVITYATKADSEENITATSMTACASTQDLDFIVVKKSY